MPISLRYLLSLGHLPAHTVLAGEAGLDARVSTVEAGTTVRALEHAGQGSLVVFTAEQLPLDEVDADLAIRFAAGAGVAGLLSGPSRYPVALSTLRLADKYRVPLITAEFDQRTVVTALEADIRAPEVSGAQRIIAVLRQLSPQTSTAAQVLRVLRGELGVQVALLDAEAHPVEGDETPDWLALVGQARDALAAPHPAARVLDVDGGDLVLHPVVLPPNERAGLWLAAFVPADLVALLDTVRHCLAVGAWAFTSHLATRSLVTEIQRGHRALLLTEILEHPESLSRQVVERATVLGWRLSGWHTVVQFAASDASVDVPGGLADDLEAALAAVGVTSPVVERPDGWVCWVTDETARDRAGQDALAQVVRTALLAVEGEYAGLRLCAGIGLPGEGAAGLASSMRDARKAGLLARSRETKASVERTDPVGLRRMLLAWYAYAPARDVAVEVLQPLRDADPSGQLIRTLGCYLDHESSLAATAAVLGVHRNTVLHRLARIRDALGVDLDDPNNRLAAHLATRAEQLPRDDEQSTEA